MLQENPQYAQGRYSAFVADITQDDFETQRPGSVGIVTLVSFSLQ